MTTRGALFKARGRPVVNTSATGAVLIPASLSFAGVFARAAERARGCQKKVGKNNGKLFAKYRDLSLSVSLSLLWLGLFAE